MIRLVAARLMTALMTASFCVAAPYDSMDYGPFISATFVAPWPKNNVSHRGVAVHFEVSNPKQQSFDELEVQSAALSSDGKTVTLKVDNLQPVMQMKIAYNLKTADGTRIQNAIYNTINVVGDMRAEVHPGEFRVVRVNQKQP